VLDSIDEVEPIVIEIVVSSVDNASLVSIVDFDILPVDEVGDSLVTVVSVVPVDNAVVTSIVVVVVVVD
jgi:hypothetical protein